MDFDRLKDILIKAEGLDLQVVMSKTLYLKLNKHLGKGQWHGACCLTYTDNQFRFFGQNIQFNSFDELSSYINRLEKLKIML